MVGDRGLLDLALRTHQPLRQRRLGKQKGAGNLSRSESPQGSERQRNLRLLVDGGVATSEDETQAVVFKRAAHFFVNRAEARFVLIKDLAFVVSARLFTAGGRDECIGGVRDGR